MRAPFNSLKSRLSGIATPVFRILFFAFVLCGYSPVVKAQVPTKSPDGQYNNNLDANGCIVQGYDVVDMFAKPDQTIKGLKDFESQFQGAKYWFSSAANKRTFDLNPAKYAVQFGGYCSLAVTEGNLRPIQVWTHEITDGYLVVNHNGKAKKLWDHRSSHKLKLAFKKWPTVRQKPAAYDYIHKGETQAALSATSFDGPPTK
jgi:YHS domain-containing protein